VGRLPGDPDTSDEKGVDEKGVDEKGVDEKGRLTGSLGFS